MTLTIIDSADQLQKVVAPDEESNARTIGACWKSGVIDLVGSLEDENTARHYEYQWSREVGFQDFSRANRTAMGRRLGGKWVPALHRWNEARMNARGMAV